MRTWHIKLADGGEIRTVSDHCDVREDGKLVFSSIRNGNFVVDYAITDGYWMTVTYEGGDG